MTISTTIRKFTYTGNGSTTTFSFPAYFILPSHLFVTLITVANGTRTPLTLGVDYSTQGAGNLGGGLVTTTVAYSSAFQIEIARTVPITQQTDYQPNDTLPAEVVELDFDYLTMICQQLDDRTTALELAGGAGGLVSMANVGAGTGLIFRDKVGSTFNLKSLKAGTGLTIVNGADDITLSAASGGIAFPGTTNQFLRGDGNFSNTFVDGPFLFDFAASNDTLQWKLRSGAVDFKWWSWRLSSPDTLALWAQKDDFTYVGKAFEFVRDVGAAIKTTAIGGRVLIGGAADDATSSLHVHGTTTLDTPLALLYGGTGASTQQAAIDNVGGAAGMANESVLTKDTATGHIIGKLTQFYQLSGYAGTVARTVQSKLDEYVSVHDFGAKGDGATDDTAAIQLAFTNAAQVSFAQGKTYRVTDTIYLSHPSFAIAVRAIRGNGATISFESFARSCTDDLATTIFGLMGASSTTSGAYDGWNGLIDGLNCKTGLKIVMVGGDGNRFYVRGCVFTATSSIVKGCVLLRNNINTHFQNNVFDMRAVCTDTTGSGSFFTAAYNGVNQNIPSSFGLMLFQYPAQVDTLGRGISSITGGSYFNDNMIFTENLFAGGQTGLLDGGSQSHEDRVIQGNEFAYNHYGLITNGAPFISNNWFENTKFACLRTVAGGPPWYAGLPAQPLFVVGNSFSPHNAGTGLLLDFIPNDSVFQGNAWMDFVVGGTFVNVGGSGLGNRAWWINNTNVSVSPGAISGLSSISSNTAFTIIGGSAAEEHANGSIWRAAVKPVALAPGLKIVTVGATSLTIADCMVFADATGGNVTLNLPAANAGGSGWSQTIFVKRIDSSGNTVTVQRAGGDTLDGGTSITISALGARQFNSDGSAAWYIL